MDENSAGQWDDFSARIERACEGSENLDAIEKVANAGEIFEEGGDHWQRMFNGIVVLKDGYYGDWMSELIRRLNGFHEPQEEKVFHAVISQLEEPSTFIELGCYWGWYSLWFKKLFPKSSVVVVEPDPGRLAVGRKNFEKNNVSVNAELGFIAAEGDTNVEVSGGVDPVTKSVFKVPRVSLSGLVKKYGLKHLDVVHADIQGAELEMLEDARKLLRKRAIDYLFISTHWLSIHVECLDFLKALNYSIIAEHTPEESYTIDGLIVAQSPNTKPITVEITKAS